MASLVQAGNNGASIVDGAAVLFTNSLVAHRTAAEESVGGALESALTAADNEGVWCRRRRVLARFTAKRGG